MGAIVTLSASAGIIAAVGIEKENGFRAESGKAFRVDMLISNLVKEDVKKLD